MKEDQIDLLIHSSYQEIEKVSMDMVKAVHAGYAAATFYKDNTNKQKEAGVLLAVFALKSFSEYIISVCEEFIETSPSSTFISLYQSTRNFHSDLLKNLNAFEQSYREQTSLYGN